jgi:hypothetical protein
MTAPPAVIDLDALDAGRRAWLQGLMASGSVLLRQDGTTAGTLVYAPAVLEGELLPASPTTHTDAPGDLREGPKVLATTMRLSGRARELLRESFGRDWVVLDFHDAPDTADVVLTSPYSPRLIHRWSELFPHAQIIVTEILDPDLCLDIAGPVGRLLDAGAHAYLPPRPLEHVAENVQIYLASRATSALSSSSPGTHQLDS